MIRRFLSRAILLPILALLTACIALAAGPAQQRLVVIVPLHDTLQPLSEQTFAEQMREAAELQPSAILLDLSTPGGNPASAAHMAEVIQHSPIPVVVYVREPGTHVGGEGLRLMGAATAVAMQADTRILPLQRRRLRGGSGAEHDAEIDALEQSLRQSLLRRGRSTVLLDDLLTGTGSMTPQQAMQAGLIDAVTPRDDDALRTLSTPSAVSGHGATPDLRGARTIELSLSSRQHLMRALMNPDLTVLLLTLGALLIFLEINTPGTIIPGAAGVLLVLLSTYALLQMDLRWQGVALLALSAALLFAEAQFPRGSAYGVGAVVALTLGLRLLVRGRIPELEVDWSTSVGAGLGFGGITAGLVLLGVRARRAKVKTGAEAMLGWLAIAQTPLQPTGEVLVRGELWRARLSDPASFLPVGECVKVQSSDGMTLEVSPMPLTMQAEQEPG